MSADPFCVNLLWRNSLLSLVRVLFFAEIGDFPRFEVDGEALITFVCDDELALTELEFGDEDVLNVLFQGVIDLCGIDLKLPEHLAIGLVPCFQNGFFIFMRSIFNALANHRLDFGRCGAFCRSLRPEQGDAGQGGGDEGEEASCFHGFLFF